MLALAATGDACEGDWLMADCQTAGRGRMARLWLSPVGNLYASGLVDLRAHDPGAATLALVAAVALFDALAIWAPTIKLKWPNDVLAGRAKLSGILLERSGNAVVIGFGVNLACHPETIDRPVTSLAALGITAPEPAVFLDGLVGTFDGWLGCWRTQGLAAIRLAWLDRSFPVGAPLVVNLPDGTRLAGVFDGLTDDCALRLRLADGDRRVIHAGDVFLI
jgi:BirA family transcriptional regulator, biotin operon repressor / biotin---[acetyl-CoA-carboxylase] ligase